MSGTGPPNLNSKHAWRELVQRGLPKRSASERVADFLEIYGLYDEATAREQASRCIQCPNPSCVTGCPLCNPIPQWMLLTAEGRFLEAAAVLGSVTNMAEVCARVCPADHLCEGKCLLESVSEPVSIQAIEQFLTDYAARHGQVDTSTAPPTGKRVAVVGSGPCGLACADELAKRGHSVTVFDLSLMPGGLLVNGVPAFRLERSVIQKRIEVLQKRGVSFRLGVRLCEDMALGDLRTEFDAVFLGFDSRAARPLEIPGAGLGGVVQALPFLLQKNTAIPLATPQIEVENKRVLVLGGGDTALDCLRAAKRYGAREAVGAYRREEKDMPCTRRDYESAVEEGAEFVFNASPVSVLGNESGQASGVRLIRTKMGSASGEGRRSFEVCPGTEFDLAADLVVAALGFEPLPCPHTGDFGELAINSWGGIIVDEGQMTSVPGVYAGGDIVRGPSLILDAVRDARKAAEGIGTYLGKV